MRESTTTSASGKSQVQKLTHPFFVVRLVLTVLGGCLFALVLLMIAYAVIVEGDSLFGPVKGANIGLGWLIMALIINVPIWLLWLVRIERH